MNSYCRFNKKETLTVLVGYFFLIGVCLFALSFFPDHDNGYTEEDQINPEGPWYSEQFLEGNPQYKSDMYLCSNYYKQQQKHTVPIVCGPEDGQCGVTNCDCVCHKALNKIHKEK